MINAGDDEFDIPIAELNFDDYEFVEKEIKEYIQVEIPISRADLKKFRDAGLYPLAKMLVEALKYQIKQKIISDKMRIEQKTNSDKLLAEALDRIARQLQRTNNLLATLSPVIKTKPLPLENLQRFLDKNILLVTNSGDEAESVVAKIAELANAHMWVVKFDLSFFDISAVISKANEGDYILFETDLATGELPFETDSLVTLIKENKIIAGKGIKKISIDVPRLHYAVATQHADALDKQVRELLTVVD